MRWFSVPKMAISLPLAILAALTLVGINETGYTRSSTALADISKSQQTRANVNQLLMYMLDAETGQRGFLLTGDNRYLQPYDSAVTNINQTLTSLQLLYRDDSAQLLNFSQLAQHVSRKLSEMELSVRLRKQNNDDAWKFILTTDVGREHMEAIRTQSRALIDDSTRKMDAGKAQITQALQLARIGIALVVLAGLVAFYMYLRQTSALQRAGEREQKALERERLRLEDQVRERTATLAELATHLQQVREDERGHLARELHDELGALLTAAKLDVARLKSKIGTLSPDVVERIQHLTSTLNSGIALKRRIVEDLRPSSLSHLGLVASLEILAREFEERSGLTVTTSLETVELGGAAQLTVYRLVQESLTNMTKYANATQAEIRLENFDGYVAVEVRDNGKGFNTTNVSPGSHGLAGMRHRVEAAGGRLTVTSAAGTGTRISAVLPKIDVTTRNVRDISSAPDA